MSNKKVEFIYYYEMSIIVSVFYAYGSERHRKILTDIEHRLVQHHVDLTNLPISVDADELASILEVAEKDRLDDNITQFELLLHDLTYRV